MSVHFHDIARLVLNHAVSLNNIGIAQANTLAQHQALVLFIGLFSKVIGINVKLPGEWKLSFAKVFTRGMTRGAQRFNLLFGVIRQHQLERMQNTHAARRVLIQVIANSVFEHGHVDNAIGARRSHHVAESPDGGGRKAPTTHTGYGGHPRIVPAGHYVLIHELFQLAFAGHRITGVESAKLVLPRAALDRQILNKPIIKRAVVLKLQGTDRVRDALDGILLAVGEIVGRIDHPVIAGLVMWHLADAIENRVTQVHIGRCHINLGSQHPATLIELPGLHPGQQIKILGYITVPVGAIAARFCQGTAILPRLFGRQIIDISPALLHEVNRPIVQLLEITGGKANIPIPLITQPPNISLDGVNELLALFLGIGVIESQITASAELLGESEVHTDGLRVPNVKVSIGLRRKARDDFRHSSGVEIIGDDGLQKVCAGPVFHWFFSSLLARKGA